MALIILLSSKIVRVPLITQGDPTWWAVYPLACEPGPWGEWSRMGASDWVLRLPHLSFRLDGAGETGWNDI